MPERRPPKQSYRRVILNPKTVDATLIPTMILVGVILGYYLGAWVGSYFPGYENAITAGGALYGLAAGLYQAWKVLQRILQDQKDKTNST